ncbi:prostacyclin synthase isoform X2 [Rhinatrema bivittatum]|uniref:prostacyclin synthase isoform X2 n=1 Tax=Rhinatrema bivittatum TaxID=194408 RepID=UPI00112B7C1A|nr:prostacyclin synthase isoform X2 [Rhinatrema bivittatum]
MGIYLRHCRHHLPDCVQCYQFRSRRHFHFAAGYSSSFKVHVAGRFITVLLDPHSYDAVVYESSRKLDFNKFARFLMKRMFDVNLPAYDPATEKAMMKLHLQNKSLPGLTKAMFFNLHTLLLCDTEKASTEWREAGLFAFAYSVMLRAGYLTLYGNESVDYTDPTFQTKDRELSAEVFNEFYRLDRLLMRLARSMLSTEEKREVSGIRVRLWELLSVKKLNARANRSSWLESYQRHLEELGVDEAMQSRAFLLQLWATQGNAGPAAFWLLLFLLKHPDAMAAVQAESERVFKSKGRILQEMEGIKQEVLDSTPVFDSVLNETLRLTAAPFITREVLEDMPLKLADGREYSLRKGDRLCLFPFLSPQMDSEVYEDPKKFKYDRFLNPDGTNKEDFYKGGKKLKNYNMPWGAGNNVCVGKYHAINSIKQFVFIFLASFDLELKDPEEEIPNIDPSRYGFGMVQPESDVKIRFKMKKSVKW